MHRCNRWFFARHLEEDEAVIAIIHKHWLLGLRFLFWPTVAVVTSIALLAFFKLVNPVPILFYASALVAVFCIVWWLRNFFDYYLDAWIVTDQCLIDVAWHGWFHRESARVLYSDIQGVSYEIQGLWATFLRYGTVSVEKISTGSVISIEYVPRPRKVERLIMRCMEGYLYSKNLKDASHVQELLSEIVAREVQLQEFDESERAPEEPKPRSIFSRRR